MNEDFRKNLKIVPDNLNEIKLKKIEAYKQFVSEAMPGYILFMEALNYVVNQWEMKGVIGKTKLKSRVKDINSALTNTEEKTLDDIFGFEIITQDERDKEMLMLVIHNIFVPEYMKQKNHNKSNGYFAHHCTGSIKKGLNGNEVSELKRHILESETDELKKEYRDMSIKEQKKNKKSEIFTKKPRYPILKREIIASNKVDSELQNNFRWAIEFITQYLESKPELKKCIPVMELQFKTKEVENEAKYGKAQHAKYKNVDENKIMQAYYDRRLVRGVDFPFTFIRNEKGGLEIEQANETLINVWPFIKDAVSKYNQINTTQIANYDMYFAKIFPGLERYVQKNATKEPSIPASIYNSEMAWGILKNKIINNSFTLPEVEKIPARIASEK